MAKLNTNTVLPVGVLAGSASQLGQINVPKLGGMLIAVPAPGSIGPAGPASTVPGPQGPTGPMGPKGVDGAGALTASGLGSLVHSAGPVTTVVDADEFAVADSADSFKAKRFSWANLKAAILAWFGPATATLSNKNLSAASNVFPSSLVTLTGAQSLSSKTLVTPTITGPTISPVTAAPNALAARIGSADLRSASQNVAVGYSSHSAVTTGDKNVAVGFVAQSGLTVGTDNSAIGRAAQTSLIDGDKNCAFGASSQQQLTSGSSNTAVGFAAQHAPLGAGTSATITASKQTAVGAQSGQLSATQVDGITAVGYWATAGNTDGVAIGILSRCQHDNAVALGANTNTTAADQVAVGPRDVEITDATKGLVLKSPDGKRWRVTVDNAGALSAAAV